MHLLQYRRESLQAAAYEASVSAASLRSKVALISVATTLEAVGSRVALAYPETNEGRTFLPIPLRQYRTGELRPAFIALMAAVGLLLLIVCANLASLTLARGSTRRREVSVRAAMGARRGRIVRQLLTESVLLSITGGVLGLVLGFLGMRGLLASVHIRPCWYERCSSKMRRRVS